MRKVYYPFIEKIKGNNPPLFAELESDATVWLDIFAYDSPNLSMSDLVNQEHIADSVKTMDRMQEDLLVVNIARIVAENAFREEKRKQRVRFLWDEDTLLHYEGSGEWSRHTFTTISRDILTYLLWENEELLIREADGMLKRVPFSSLEIGILDDICKWPTPTCYLWYDKEPKLFFLPFPFAPPTHKEKSIKRCQCGNCIAAVTERIRPSRPRARERWQWAIRRVIKLERYHRKKTLEHKAESEARRKLRAVCDAKAKTKEEAAASLPIRRPGPSRGKGAEQDLGESHRAKMRGKKAEALEERKETIRKARDAQRAKMAQEAAEAAERDRLLEVGFAMMRA